VGNLVDKVHDPLGGELAVTGVIVITPPTGR
jgi:hypothetical protein